MRSTGALVIAMAMLLSACASAPPTPADATGDFVIERDLVGRSTARGEFRAITGLRRSFVAELQGSWDGETLTLVEDFTFADGERDRKTWRLRRVGEGRYVGVREDVVGEARGFQDGGAFRLEYDVVLPGRNGREGRRVRFRDVIVNVQDGIRNEATVGWFGVRVASVSLLIQREAEAPS
jgi:hypothetical protein